MNAYTIVIPCFNEAARLDTVAFQRYTLEHPACHFLFVDDGSTDNTLEVLTSLSLADEQCQLLSLPKNVGKAAAVRLGMLQAIESASDFVGYWDADLATPLVAISDFLRQMSANPDLQLVCGARVKLLGRHVERQPLRHYLGRVFATAASRVLHLPVYDTQCGAKLFRNNAETQQIFAAKLRTSWIFDVELLARMWNFRHRHGLPHPADAIYELPLDTWQDVAGSKVRPHDFFQAFRQLVDVHRHYRPYECAARFEHVDKYAYSLPDDPANTKAMASPATATPTEVAAPLPAESPA